MKYLTIVVEFRYYNKHNQKATDVEWIHHVAYNIILKNIIIMPWKKKLRIKSKFHHAKLKFKVATLKFANAKLMTADAKLNAAVAKFSSVVA